MRRFEVAGFRRIVLVGAILASLASLAIGIDGTKLRAQTQLADPRDAPKIFASTCSACHKSPQGLAKSGQVAGFLRQHYTTGPEMSAAMAAYLVAAGSAPAAKKGAETAQKQKAKKEASQQPEHAALASPATDAKDQRTLRGKQRGKDEQRPAVVQPAPAEPVHQTAAAPAVAPAAPGESPAASAPAPEAGPPPVVFDIPLPEMPQAPPADLTQSAFTSSPLP
jgi:hypothetical protein